MHIIISQRQQDKYYRHTAGLAHTRYAKQREVQNKNAVLNMQRIFQIKSQHLQQLILSLQIKLHTVLSILKAQTSN